MLHRTSFYGLLARAAVLTSFAGVAGCGGLSAGDYVFYRVSFEKTAPSAKCYPGGQIPPSIKEDTTSFRSGATFIVYVASDEEALLDTGDAVLPGTISGDSYSFSGKDKDVEPVGGGFIIDSDHNGVDDSLQDFVDADGDGLNDRTNDPFVDVDNDGYDDRFEDNLVDANNDGVDDRIVEVPSDTKFTNTTTVTIDMTVDGSAVTGTQKVTTKTSCAGSQCPVDYGTSCTRTTEFKGVEIDDANLDLGD